MSQALEIIEALGAEPGLYVPKLGQSRTIPVLVQPLRRTDAMGNQEFLTKTFELWIVKGPEGVDEITVNADAVAVYLNKKDQTKTTLKITKVYPERDEGIPGDGVGMWHVEAVQ